VLVDIDRQIVDDMDLSLKSLYRTAPEVDYQEVDQSNVQALVLEEVQEGDITDNDNFHEDGVIEGKQ
jgi:hypothetical protein